MQDRVKDALRTSLAQARRVPPKWRLGIGAVVVVLFVVVIASGGDDDRGATGGKVPKPAKPTKNNPGNVGAPIVKRPDVPTLAEERKKNKKTAGNCGEEATDKCAPRLAVGDSLKNDGLTWRIESVSTVKSVGSPAVTATGTFLAVKLSVKSDSDDTKTLTDLDTAVKMGKSNFATDPDATQAIVGENQRDFVFNDLEPGKTETGTILYDIPSDRVGDPGMLRINQVGADTSVSPRYGFIKLPPLNDGT